MAVQDPANTKALLRTQFLAKRQELGEEELENRNQGLLAQLENLRECITDKKTIHIFLSIRRQAEPDTYRLVDWINHQFAPVRWVVGKTERKTSGMYHYVWNEDSLIRENKWGIPEPLGGIRVAEKELDLIFVPLLVIDRQGQRVGYGKGYYDRFLAKCRPDALKIGVSLFEPVDQIADPSPTDIPLNGCITPQGTFWFGK